jgi:hypothetical protein
MRRLYLFCSLMMATAWLLWSACERDDYRNELPLKPLDGGRPAPTDLPVDLAKPSDLSQIDLSAQMDMAKPADQGSAGDAGTTTDGGLSDGALGG